MTLEKKRKKLAEKPSLLKSRLEKPRVNLHLR